MKVISLVGYIKGHPPLLVPRFLKLHYYLNMQLPSLPQTDVVGLKIYIAHSFCGSFIEMLYFLLVFSGPLLCPQVELLAPSCGSPGTCTCFPRLLHYHSALHLTVFYAIFSPTSLLREGTTIYLYFYLQMPDVSTILVSHPNRRIRKESPLY